MCEMISINEIVGNFETKSVHCMKIALIFYTMTFPSDNLIFYSLI